MKILFAILAFVVCSGSAYGDAEDFIDIQGTGGASGTSVDAAAPYKIWNTGIANGTDVTSDLSFAFGSTNQYTITFNVAAHNANGPTPRMFTTNDPPNANNIDGPANPVVKETLALRNDSPLNFTVSGLAANQTLTMYVVEAAKPNQATGGGNGSGASWTLGGGAAVQSVNIAQDNLATYTGSITDLNSFTNIGSASGGADIAGTVTRFDNTWNHVVGGMYLEVVTVGPIQLGDVNLDGAVDFLDISPFISLLSSGGFQTEADCDLSGAVDFLDIGPFIAILSAS